MKIQKLAFGLFLIIVLGIVFYVYGRSIYMPMVKKIKKKETVTSILTTIEKDVWNRLESDLGIAGFKMDFPREIILIAFKEEQILQVYAVDNVGVKFIKEYAFTGYSGELGPKLKEGDRQIPEGIYKVEYLNPNSNFYLSIKVDYPNEFDKSKSNFSKVTDMGGDIFIHGKSMTVGCIPVGDEAIEEIFVLTQKAMQNTIKVIISPRDFRTNPEYPDIGHVTWEKELYDQISAALKELN